MAISHVRQGFSKSNIVKLIDHNKTDLKPRRMESLYYGCSTRHDLSELLGIEQIIEVASMT